MQNYNWIKDRTRTATTTESVFWKLYKKYNYDKNLLVVCACAFITVRAVVLSLEQGLIILCVSV